MIKSFIFDNNIMVTIFGNFGELNSFVVTFAHVKHIIRGLHGVTIFDTNGKKYNFECSGNTKFIVDGFEHKALNNAYKELEEEMMNL